MLELMMNQPRACGTCTKCCEGWLQGEAHGRPFWIGRPCHFLEAGKCSIYEQRPDAPCKSYRCMWLDDSEIPGWLKPDEVNAIITWRRVDGIEFADITEAGEKLRPEVLSWALMHFVAKGVNVRYQVGGGSNRYGTEEFVKARL